MAQKAIISACSDQSSAAHLPDEFIAYLKQNNVDLETFSIVPDDIPRFVRVAPPSAARFTSREALAQACGGESPTLVPWIPGFLQLPGSASVSQMNGWKNGTLFGIDASSGAAVLALDPQPGERILEVCCAPGSKMCMIADWMQRKGSLTGVDLSLKRLTVAATQLRKYDIAAVGQSQPGWRFRLFWGDGTTFAAPPGTPPSTEAHQLRESGKKSKRGAETPCPTSRVPHLPSSTTPAETPRSPYTGPPRPSTDPAGQRSACGAMLILDSTFENSRKSHARAKGVSKAVKRYLHLERLPEPQPTDACLADDAAMPADGSEDGLYDRVLVDAECTHDGSLKHLTKFHSLGWETFCERVLHPDRFPHLQALQLQLLSQGYRLTRPSGVVVYSTCSLTRAQNEEVVQLFLAEHPEARLEDVGEAMQEAARRAAPQYEFLRAVARTPAGGRVEGLGPGGGGEEVDEVPWVAGGIDHTVRFDPLRSGTSGLFIARIRKPE